MTSIEMGAMPLGLMSPGQAGIVKCIAGGRQVQGRLAELGLIPGVKVRVCQTQPRGPLVISLGEARVAIGRGVAQKIIVEDVSAS